LFFLSFFFPFFICLQQSLPFRSVSFLFVFVSFSHVRTAKFPSFQTQISFLFAWLKVKTFFFLSVKQISFDSALFLQCFFSSYLSLIVRSFSVSFMTVKPIYFLFVPSYFYLYLYLYLYIFLFLISPPAFLACLCQLERDWLTRFCKKIKIKNLNFFEQAWNKNTSFRQLKIFKKMFEQKIIIFRLMTFSKSNFNDKEMLFILIDLLL
jgi:hypothetical protein